MKWLDTIWTKVINYHKIQCDCGLVFNSPAHHSMILCVNCGRKGTLYANELPLLGNDVEVILTGGSLNGRAPDF